MAELYAPLLLLLLVSSTWLGWRVQRVLPEHHRRHDSVDAVRLVMSMLVTFSALVLGLLTSDAKSRYDAHDANLRRYSVDLIVMDQALREYGAEAGPARALLRAYTAAAVADTWPGEPHPDGSYPGHLAAPVQGSIESMALGSMLLRINAIVAHLSPGDPYHQRLALLLQDRMSELLQQRWVLVESAHATIHWPFLSVMVIWLVLVFAIFGLSSPANGLVFAVVALCALSVSLALYTILDFDRPLTGLLKVSSSSMREALMHMDQPVPPAADGG